MAGLLERAGATLRGDKKLQRSLDELSKSVQKRIIRDALNKGAGVIKKQAIQNAKSSKDGVASIKKNIIVKVVRKKQPDLQLVLIGVRNKTYTIVRKASILKSGKFGKKHGFAIQAKSDLLRHIGQKTERLNPGKIAHFVESGRSPVRPKGQKAMVTKSGEWIGYAAKGVIARPFMRPAYRTKKKAALTAIRVKIWKEIKKQARKRK